MSSSKSSNIQSQTLNKVTQKLTENGSIINMQYNYFINDRTPQINEFEILFSIVDDYTSDIVGFEISKRNILIILFFVLAEEQLKFPDIPLKRNYLDYFNKIISKPMKELNEYQEEYYSYISNLNFCYVINKIEFLMKYQSLYKYEELLVLIKSCKEELIACHQSCLNLSNKSDIYTNKFYYLNEVFQYYTAAIIILEKNFDLAYSELLNLHINLSEYSFNINDSSISNNRNNSNFIDFLTKKSLILQIIIDKYRKNFDLELQNLKSLHSLPASSELIIRVSLNISDCYFYKNEIDLLNYILTETNNFLKVKNLYGSNNISNFLENSILIKLRLLYCTTLLYHKYSNNFISNYIQSHSNKNEQIINNEAIKQTNSTSFNGLNISYSILSELNDIFHSIISSNNLKNNSDDKQRKIFTVPFSTNNTTFFLNSNIIDQKLLGKLLSTYQVYFTFYKKIYSYDRDIGFLTNLLKDNKDILSHFSTDNILNIYLLKQNDFETNKCFNQKLKAIVNLPNSNDSELSTNEVVINLFYLYNKIANIQSCLISDINNSKTQEYSNSIIEYSKIAISNLNLLQNSKNSTKYVQYPYIKCLISNIYFSYAYALYILGNYREANNIILIYKKNCLSENGIESIKLLKLRGDIAFKEKRFKEAIQYYSETLLIKNLDMQTKATINFNYGMCCIALKDSSSTKERLLLSLENYNWVEPKTLYVEEHIDEIKNILKVFNIQSKS